MNLNEKPLAAAMTQILRGTCLGLALAAASAPAALAQAPAIAELRRYDVPAGPLPEALTAFAAQAGISLSFDPTALAGLNSSGLRGELSIRDGFAKLLAGTGYQHVATGDGEYTLKPVPQSADVLPAVRVSAGTLAGATEGSGSLTTAGPVVAATGLNLSLRETPQSVTVITRERIEKQNLNSLAEIAEQVTGVYYNARGTPIGGRTLMYARGFAIDSYQIDGVNVPWEALAESERYGHGSLDTAIYDSVTVVRGATGLMTGAGEPSALMALTRKKPTRELQAILEASAGSWDRYRLMADVGGPLNSSGNLRGRVVGAWEEGDTWVDNYRNERSIFYGALEADLGQRTLLTLTLEYSEADSDGAPWAEDYGAYLYFAGGAVPIPKNTDTSIAPHWSTLDSDRTYATVTLDYQFNDAWKAKLSYGYGEFNSGMRRGMVNVIPADGSLTAARVLSLDFSYDTHIIDARVEGRYPLFGREHDLIAGLNIYRTDQAAPLGFYGVLPRQAAWSNGQLNYVDPDWSALAGSPDDYPYDIETRQEGLFLATRLRPTDRLSVILGARLTNWEYFYADRATALHDYFVYSDLDYDEELTPYAGVVVDLTKALSAYASYTQIFKPQEVRDTSGDLLEPEEGTTYEIGLKGAWYEGRLNANVALFESRRDNLAVALVDATGAPITAPNGDQAYNANDDTEGRGWELEVAGELLPGWQMQAGYTYFRNEDSDGRNLDTTQPRQQFKLYTSYQPAQLPKLTAGASLRWQDDTHVAGNSDPRYAIDSYSVLGVNLAYQLSPQLGLSLVVNNVLDKEHRVSNYSHTYGAPLNATVAVRVKF